MKPYTTDQRKMNQTLINFSIKNSPRIIFLLWSYPAHVKISGMTSCLPQKWLRIISAPNLTIPHPTAPNQIFSYLTRIPASVVIPCTHKNLRNDFMSPPEVVANNFRTQPHHTAPDRTQPNIFLPDKNPCLRGHTLHT